MHGLSFHLYTKYERAKKLLLLLATSLDFPILFGYEHICIFFISYYIYGIGNIGASYLLMHIIKQSTRNISKFKFIQLINLSYCSHKPLSQASKFSNFHVSRHVKIRTKPTKRKRNEMKWNETWITKKKRMKNKIVKIQQSVDKSKSFKPHWWYCFPLTVWWIRVCCWECKSNPTHILQWDTKQTSNPHHLQHFFLFIFSFRSCALFLSMVDDDDDNVVVFVVLQNICISCQNDINIEIHLKITVWAYIQCKKNKKQTFRLVLVVKVFEKKAQPKWK